MQIVTTSFLNAILRHNLQNPKDSNTMCPQMKIVYMLTAWCFLPIPMRMSVTCTRKLGAGSAVRGGGGVGLIRWLNNTADVVKIRCYQTKQTTESSLISE